MAVADYFLTLTAPIFHSRDTLVNPAFLSRDTRAFRICSSLRQDPSKRYECCSRSYKIGIPKLDCRPSTFIPRKVECVGALSDRHGADLAPKAQRVREKPLKGRRVAMAVKQVLRARVFRSQAPPLNGMLCSLLCRTGLTRVSG